MSKYIRILEAPFYILVIAIGCFASNSNAMGVFLTIGSIARLVVNIMTDNTTN